MNSAKHGVSLLGLVGRFEFQVSTASVQGKGQSTKVLNAITGLFAGQLR
jgi:hypothetical protein